MIIQLEAPIHIQVLGQRLLARFDLKRATVKAIRRVEQLLPRTGAKKMGDFIWNNIHQRENYVTFRCPGDQQDQQRKANEIAPEEVANAALIVLQQNISLDVIALTKETARLFGFARMGKQVETAMQEGIEVLEQRNKCRISDGRANLV